MQNDTLNWESVNVTFIKWLPVHAEIQDFFMSEEALMLKGAAI